MPMISVIVPVYKVEKYLHECVNSILAQTYTDFELILVDDGSPDNCGVICDEYAQKDTRVRVIHQQNQGLSGARNAGMDIAQGDFVAFVDSDDAVSPWYLKLLFDAMRDGTDISVCSFCEFQDGEAPCFKDQVEAIFSLYDRKSALTALYNGILPVNAWGKLYRLSVVKKLRFPLGRLHEDQFFTPNAFYQAQRIAVCNEKVYFYRNNAQSITRNAFSVKRYDDLWAIDSCIAFFREKGEKEIVEAALRRRKRLLCTYALYARGAGVEIPEQYKIGLGKALLYLRRNVTVDKYQYCLAQVHPKLVTLDAYARKIESILGLSRK